MTPEPALHEPLVKIASGGTATVYVGRRPGDLSLVAIKRMHPYLATERVARDQMRREARLAGGVVHENLVRIHGVEGEGEALHLIMDYVEGGSLAELLAKGALPRPIGLSILRDALAGLAALHAITDDDGRLRFVHRDVSPQNIFVGLDGIARLGDFGLLTRGDATHSHTSSIRGKLAYMAPEQVEGERAAQSVDTYAMGVVMWETLTGRRLFRGANDADTIRRVMVGDAPPLIELLPDCPPALDALVMRCLQRDPTVRFEHARALQDAFRMVTAELELAPAAAIHALIEERLGDVLARRRATLAAAMDAESTATGDIDIDAMAMASGWQDPEPPDEATLVEGTFDWPTLVEHALSEPTETLDPESLQRWSGAFSSAPPPALPPPALRTSTAPPSTLETTAPPSRARWTLPLVAAVAAAGGAGLAWMAQPATEAPAPASVGPPPAPTATVPSAPPTLEPLPVTSASAVSSSSAPSGTASAKKTRPTPVPRRPAAVRPTPPPAKDVVVVPDNPYR